MDASDIDLIQYIERPIEENEIFISFTSDWMAECYNDWWNEEGLCKFIEYANKNKDIYKE